MLARYKVYEEFFGIEKRAALYKVKKEKLNENDLNIFEKFILMLSSEEIKEIVSFIDGESPALDIRIKRSKDRNIIKSSINIVHELITVAIVDNEIYQTYKEINKKPEQILLEHKNKLILEEQKRKEILRSEDDNYEWEEYCHNKFKDQTEFQCFDAFILNLLGDKDEAEEMEKNYRQIPIASKQAYILPDYANFLYAQETIDIHCHHFFEEKIDLIVDSIAEKNIIQYMLDSDDIFTTHIDTLSELLKIPPKLILHFGRESYTQLFKKFQIEYLL